MIRTSCRQNHDVSAQSRPAPHLAHPAPHLDTTRPFSRADARAARLPLAELLSSRYQRIFYDLYLSASVPVTLQVRARAALTVSPKGSHLSHQTAAQMWGGVVPDSPDTHVSVPMRGARTERLGIKAHLSPSGSSILEHRGLPVSTPDQCFLEMAAGGLGLVDLVILGDSLVAKKRLTPKSLIHASDRYRGRQARIARRAARLVRQGVDSPMETRLRLLLVLAGFPEPDVNVILRGSTGDWLMRFDLAYPDINLLIEYDGRQHASDDVQWGRDIERREELDRLGLRILIVRSADIHVHPADTLDRIRTTMRSLGAKNVPGRFKAEWSRHFPGRPQQ